MSIGSDDMVQRSAYFVGEGSRPLVREEVFSFKWFPGFSIQQKQRTIDDFHRSIKGKYQNKNVLEVSTKSPDYLGVRLSAFNLTLCTKKYKKVYSVESAFQSSKVFEKGGPYLDLLEKTSREAKKDIRIRTSGRLLYFCFFGERWPLVPKTSFYDWVYINALSQHEEIVNEVLQYDCFTDIEFNASRSINCQARSVALFVSLSRRGMLDDVLCTREKYLSVIKDEAGDSGCDRVISEAQGVLI